MKITTHSYLFAVFVLLLVLFAGSQLAFTQVVATSQPGLAPTPPMGWASWNHYFCDYNDQTIRDQADALVSSGMRDLGYRYVLIQECLTHGRNADGSLIVDGKRFPHGMKALVDYVHSRGLKAGIYTDIGVNTCAGPPYQGSYQHEDQDAATFAAWGMDFIEMDFCNHPPGITGRAIYERMAAAIQKTGRPMVFYLCAWGSESPWRWAQGTAQLWRTTGDISNEKNHVDWSRMVRNFELNNRHSVFNAPNSWNDPDMLEVGNPGLTPVEAQSHFSMWVISAAPLWAGNNLTQMSDAIRAIYTNTEALAVDQDPLGAGAEKVKEEGGVEVWMKPLGTVGSGLDAVLLLNLNAKPVEAVVEWNSLGLKDNAKVRNLWAHKDLGTFPGSYKTELPAHGSALLKVSGEFSWKNGATYEAEWPGNTRSGDAVLIPCPDECSREYAVQLRGRGNDSAGGSLTFSQIGVPLAGKYSLNLAYIYSGVGAKTVQMRVNGAQPVDISLRGDDYGNAKAPVDLNKGDNSIEFSYRGEGSVDIDRIIVSQ